ncbi:MAG: hypothetical protein Q7R48_03365 [bacterium]|nr:hypothetical protein [bacterium]
MRKFFAETIFWLHFVIVAFWYGLFFVSSSLWPWGDKITFHFWFTVAIVGHQFVWGALLMPWTRKFRMVCILNTPMQLLRGKKISDSKNYDHSFQQEFLSRHNISIPHRLTTIATFGVLAAVSLQFFLR